MIEQVLKLVNRVPMWILIPLVIFCIPVALVGLIIVAAWYIEFEPNLISKLNANNNTRAEITEERYVKAIEYQALQYSMVNDNIKSLKSQQDILLRHTLKQSKGGSGGI